MFLATQAHAQIFSGYPFTFVPNTTISSGQVNANFAAIGNAVNANAAASGVNNDITELRALANGLVPPAVSFVGAPQGGLGFDGTNVCLVRANTCILGVTSTGAFLNSGITLLVQGVATFNGAAVFNGGTNLLTAGMIVFTQGSSCPAGWNAMDGTTSAPNLAGYFPRFWGAHGSVDPQGGRAENSGQEWAMVNHTHQFAQSASSNVNIPAGGGFSTNANNGVFTNNTGGAQGVSFFDVEERPINVALLGCQKQ